MKRRELYAKVWQTPLSKLGPELGFSDVGLARLCKRHNIPVPPVGYWAKLAAGQRPPQPPLPTPGDDFTVPLPTPREIARRNAGRQRAQQLTSATSEAKRAVPVLAVELRPTLDGCHPAVSKTAKFFAGIQPAIEKADKAAARSTRLGEPNLSWFLRPKTTYGRYTSDEDGCLRIAATLTQIDWILRFHDGLIRALVLSGCKVQARHEQRSHWFEVQCAGEAVRLSFAEEYDKVPHGKQPRSSSDGYVPASEWEYRPRSTFKLKVERQIGSVKQWGGTVTDLESGLPGIARDILAILHAQGAQRKIVDAERESQRLRDEQRAAERSAWFSAQRALAQRKAARKVQIDRAVNVAKALDEFAAVARLLRAIEERSTPAPADAGLQTWIALVRSDLTDPLDTLISAVLAEAGSQGRPLWWPEDRSL